MGDDFDVVIVKRCADGPARIPDAVVVACADCGEACWLAPSSIFAAVHARAECMECVLPKLIAQREVELRPLTAEQIREIRAAMELAEEPPQ